MRRVLVTFRWFAFVGIFCWAVFIASTVRSGGPGPAPLGTLFVVLAFAGPLAVVAFLGLHWKRYFLVVFGLLVCASVVVETYAVTEEQWFLRRCRDLPSSSDVVFHDRWWPNGTSYLYCDPATGELGGSD